MNFELTLDWLHARCTDVDGCLVWKRAAAHGTHPQASVMIDGKPVTVLVRRMVWEAAHERPFPPKRVARISCDTPLCVHPEHVCAVRKRDVQVGIPRALQHRMAIAAGRRANSDLSDAAVEVIRDSVGPLDDVAEQYGIDRSYVSAIRLGKARVDFRNPFAALSAR